MSSICSLRGLLLGVVANVVAAVYAWGFDGVAVKIIVAQREDVVIFIFVALALCYAQQVFDLIDLTNEKVSPTQQ